MTTTTSPSYGSLLRAAVPQNRLLKYRGDLHKGRLANGLEYRVLSNAYPPGRIHVDLVLSVGSLHEEEDERGLAHFLEHCVFNGTEKFPDPDALRAEFTELGMAFGSDLNAHTAFQETVYTFTCPTASFNRSNAHRRKGTDSQPVAEVDCKRSRNSPEPDINLARCMTLLSEVVTKPLLDGNAFFETEKAAVKSEAHMRNSIEDRVEKSFLSQLYADTPLPRRHPIGDMNIVEACSAEKLREFYNKWYRPENACVLLVGEIDADEGEELIRNVFGDWSNLTPKKTCPPTICPTQWSATKELRALLDELVTTRPATNIPSVVQNILVTHSEKHSLASEICTQHCEGTTPSPTDILGCLIRPTRRLLPDLSKLLYKEPRERDVIFQHDQLRLMNISLVSMFPQGGIIDEREYVTGLVDTMLGLVYEARLEDILRSDPNAPFLVSCWDFSEASSEDCALNCLSVTVRPQEWQQALHIAVRTLATLARFGVDEQELEWAASVFAKNYSDAVALADTLNSGDLIEELAEDWTVGSVELDPKQDLNLYVKLGSLVINKALMDARAKEVFSFVTRCNEPLNPKEPLGDANNRPALFVSAPAHLDPNAEALVPDHLTPADVVGPIRAMRDTVMQRIADGLPTASPSSAAVASSSGGDSSSPSPAHRSTASSTAAYCADGSNNNRSPCQKFIVIGAAVREVIQAALSLDGVTHGPLLEALPTTLVNEDELTIAEADVSWLPPNLTKSRRVLEIHQIRSTDRNGRNDDSLDDSSDFDKCENRFLTHRQTQCKLARLSNGVKIIYKRTDFEKNSCTIRLAVKGGTLLEAVENLPSDSLALGIRAWLDSAVHGIKSHTVSRLMEVWAVGVSASVSHDATIISFSLNSSDKTALARTLSVAAAYFTDLTIEKAAFDKLKRETVTGKEQQERTMGGKLSQLLSRCMFPTEPHFQSSSAADVQRITFEDAQRAVKAQVHPQLMEVVICGDFDELQLQNHLKHYIGTVPKRADDSYVKMLEERFSQFPVHLFTSSSVCDVFVEDQLLSDLEKDEEMQQTHKRASLDIVLRHFGRFSTQALHQLHQEPMTLDELNDVHHSAAQDNPSWRFRVWRIVEAVLNNRLYREVREDAGLAYSVGLRTVGFEWVDRGILVAAATPVPVKLAECAERIFATLTAVVDGTAPITEDEFAAAKEPLLAELKTNLRTNDYWTELLQSIQDFHSCRSFRHIRSVEAEYLSVQLNDVRAALGQDLKLTPYTIGVGISGSKDQEKLLLDQKNAIENTFSASLLSR